MKTFLSLSEKHENELVSSLQINPGLYEKKDGTKGCHLTVYTERTETITSKRRVEL